MLKLSQRMDRINPNNDEEFKEEVRKQLSLGSDADIRGMIALVPQTETFSIFSNKKHHEIIAKNSGEFSTSVGSNTKKRTPTNMLSDMTSSLKNIIGRLYGSNSSHGATVHADTSNNIRQTSPNKSDTILQNSLKENYMNAATSPTSSNQRAIVTTDGSNGSKGSNIFLLPIVPLEIPLPLKIQNNNGSAKASFRVPRKIDSSCKRSISRDNVFSERSGQSTPSVPSGYFSHNSDYKIVCKRMNPQLSNLVGISCCHSSVENIEHPTYVAPSFHGLENSQRIIPNYYLTTNMKNGLLTVDYHFTILDDIRNLRPLNPTQLKYIDENMSNEEKQEIIVEFNRAMESFCVLLHNMD
jgi:hypothetical protein